MSNRSIDNVFALIQTLTKAEKRYFSLYISRQASSENAAYMQLFDAMSKMEQYDEKKVLSKSTSVRPAQLNNLKAHLYHQILTALTLFHSSRNLDNQIREQIAFAKILYNRGLVIQSLKVLDKAKSLAKNNSHFLLTLEILQFEKLIEARHITRSMSGRAEQLSDETSFVLQQVNEVAQLSSLTLRLYGIFLEKGHVKNEEEAKKLRLFFKEEIKGISYQQISFFGKGYLHQAYCWYYFIQLDFARYYHHALKWVNLFEDHPKAKTEDPFLYLKGLHNVVTALFFLGKQAELKVQIEKLNLFYREAGGYNENLQIQAFIYLYTAKLNFYFLSGRFSEGLSIVPEIEDQLQRYHLFIDTHRVLVFYYKIASLYFGAGKTEKAIDYLNKIINLKVGHLRSDLQCFARILHLVAHYELGNTELLEYLLKSVYRFLGTMENLDAVQKTMLNFLRRRLSSKARDERESFIELKNELERIARDKYSRRSYQYLDIVSWLESKIEQKPVELIIQDKARRMK